MENSSSNGSAIATATSWISLLVGLLCLAFVAWYIPSDRRGYIETFKDFNMELPPSTQFMVAIPDTVFLIAAIICGLAMIAVQRFAGATSAAATFHMLMIALSCLALVAYRESLAQPLSMLLHGLSR